VLPFLFPASAWGFRGLPWPISSAARASWIWFSARCHAPGRLAHEPRAVQVARAPAAGHPNALIVGAVLAYTDTQGGAAFWPIFGSTRADRRGEAAACYATRLPLLSVLGRIPVLNVIIGEGR
jgi:hypothetical protein